jgi:hypothetical protein
MKLKKNHLIKGQKKWLVKEWNWKKNSFKKKNRVNPG